MTLNDLESLYTSLTPETGGYFIKGIHAAKKNPDISLQQLLDVLEHFVAAFRPEGRRLSSEIRKMSDDEREILSVHARIVAAMLLVLQEAKQSSVLREKTLLFLEYASALVRTKFDFLMTALDVVSYPVTSVGLRWGIIEESTSVQIISTTLVTGMRFDRDHPDGFTFVGKGKVICSDGVLRVCSSDVGENGSVALSVCKDRVEVVTRNSRDERLKASDQFSAEALSVFADTFCHVQENYVGARPQKRSYVEGDRVPIQITRVDEKEKILQARIADSDVVIEGEVNNEELTKGVYTEDILPFLYEDSDYIRNAVLCRDEKGWYFSIRNAYSAYAQAMAESDIRCGIPFEARAICINDSWKRVSWMTPSGYVGLTRLNDTPGVQVGDKAVMKALNIKTPGGDVYINVRPDDSGTDSYIRFGQNESVLESFVTSYEKVVRRAEPASSDESAGKREAVRTLSSILFTTAYRGTSIDAYRHLLVALFLADATEDKAARKAICEEAYYLMQLLIFAQRGKVSASGPIELPACDASVIKLLSLWDTDDGVTPWNAASFDKGSPAREVCSLMLGLSISARFPDEVTAESETVRQRICGVLGVEDGFVREGRIPTGKYGKAELNKWEFKSSYVFRNNGAGADLVGQGKDEVFQAVCGFLNTMGGGTVYVGVNNNGDPIIAKDWGINADKAWLFENRDRLNRLRWKQLGHSTIEEKINEDGNLDPYIHFLNGEKELYFKKQFHDNIRIEATEDNDAVRITVDEAKYDIAYIYSDTTYSDPVAYVRVGESTKPMTPRKKEERKAELKRIVKEIGFVVTIQEAIDKKKRLVFKDYASGNSGEVRDRRVVPVNLFYNDENVYCYDLESRQYKQFRLHRIGSIEMGSDYTLPVVQPQKADVFRWILPDGGRSYHIKLRMDVGAKNYLLEEYSCAEQLPETEFYQEKKNKWILDTHVNGLGAVRRFYLGLADKIEILDTEDSEELKKEIEDYLKKYMPKRT